ncbi:MAG: transposase [Acidobacteria bacterium]|nr:transposase [Acidobacteriota bacterium]
MARPLRLEHPGAVWHVTSRGNAREAIFLDDGDRSAFLELLAKSVEMCRWRLHAYVLMTNHFHLLLETPEPNLSRGMRQLNGVYTQRFNRRHRRTGHVLQGRFGAVLVERNAHLLELARYVVLNPVRAGMVPSPGTWAWSSFRATAGLADGPSWLDTAWLLAQLDPGSPSRARLRYRQFVAEGVAGEYNPWDSLVGQIYLGGEEFLAGIERMARGHAAVREHPRLQREVRRPSAGELLDVVSAEFGTSAAKMRDVKRGEARKALALVGRIDGALRLREIGELLGIADWSVTNLVKAADGLMATNERFRKQVERVRARLRRAT